MTYSCLKIKTPNKQNWPFTSKNEFQDQEIYLSQVNHWKPAILSNFNLLIKKKNLFKTHIKVT